MRAHDRLWLQPRAAHPNSSSRRDRRSRDARADRRWPVARSAPACDATRDPGGDRENAQRAEHRQASSTRPRCGSVTTTSMPSSSDDNWPRDGSAIANDARRRSPIAREGVDHLIVMRPVTTTRSWTSASRSVRRGASRRCRRQVSRSAAFGVPIRDESPAARITAESTRHGNAMARHSMARHPNVKPCYSYNLRPLNGFGRA